MRRTPAVLAAIAALALVLTPTLADARAGGGSSMGSRGGRTQSAPAPTTTAPGTAQPMQRSTTPASPSPTAGAAAQAAPARSGFMSGLMGGMIGAGIAGMLFGGGMFGGMSGIGGFLGFLLQIFLVVIVARLLFKWFRNRRAATAGGSAIPAMFAPAGAGHGPMPIGEAPRNGPMGGMPPMAGIGGGRPAAPPVTIAPADYQAFEQLLKNVQTAWTAHELNALRPISTPEMLSYFTEQFAEQTSRGVRNSVTDVSLLQGDLSEAWSEQGNEYATVAMKFSMIDVTKDEAGRVADGSPDKIVTATELWTFMRSQGGGTWILSAIQQVR